MTISSSPAFSVSERHRIVLLQPVVERPLFTSRSSGQSAKPIDEWSHVWGLCANVV